MCKGSFLGFMKKFNRKKKFKYFFFWSELAAVIHESPGCAVDGLARREGHLTAAIPVHRRIIQTDSLGFKHLADRVEVLLLGRVRGAEVAEVPSLV